MSQVDFTIASQSAVNARNEIEDSFQALATKNSGANAPTTTYANMWWYETDTNILKMRNEANSGWINVAYFNQSTSKFQILDDTNVVTTSGTVVGNLGDQATSAWQAGTSTTRSLVSPAEVKAAITAQVPFGNIAPIMTTSTGTSIPVGAYVFGIDSNYFSHNLGSTFAASSYNITVYGGSNQVAINYGTWIYLGREGGNTILYQRIA